ncbi:hypothetical protein ACHAQJ_000393 [Trichoderma viride]
MATEAKTHSDYTVGWVCALPKEQTAAIAMLDERHVSLRKPPNDPNTYTLGSVGEHNIVIACLPKGQIGVSSAATVATQMISAFPSIKFGLMVGIGGGIPPKVRLGDVVVSTPVGSFPGVVQWDSGKANEDGFERTGSLDNPPRSLLAALARLETEHDLTGSKIPDYLDELKQKWPKLAPKYLKSDSLKDVLFKPNYSHVCQDPADHDATLHSDESEEEENCRFCDKSMVIKRKPREMRVHYGLIASGNQVIKSAATRNRLNQDLGGNLLCVEMEAAGLMNNFPCLVIRGICDYADSHKNNDWQEHAAAVAASFTKELLEYVQPSDVDGERNVKDILDQVLTDVSIMKPDILQIKSSLNSKEDLQVIKWITPVDYGPQHSDFLRRRQPGTGLWLLDSAEYQTWLVTEKQTLFCPGIPGAGKTILTSIVIDDVEAKFQADPTTGIAYIYCNYRRHEEQRIEDLLASLLKQLVQRRTSLPDCVRNIYNKNAYKRTRPSLDETLTALHSVIKMYLRVFIIVDALDECQTVSGCRQRVLAELYNLQEKCGVNCYTTSRFIPEIVDHFKETSVSLEIRASTEDIERYVKSRMGQLPAFIQQRQELQKEITTKISEAIDGMFLLAQFYLDSLTDKFTPKLIKNSLKDFQNLTPGSSEAKKVKVLADTYEQAMLRINAQQIGFKDLANRVLSWIIYAESQITKTELQHALAVEVDESMLDEDNLPLIQDMVSVCAGLVTVDEESNIIRLVHYTTQEYFNQTRKDWFPDAEAKIADVCATYLSFNVFECGPCPTYEELEERLQLHPLYDYAAHNWGHHARKALKLCHKVTEFLECETKIEAAVQVLMSHRILSVDLSSSQSYTKQVTGLTGLHLAAYFGIEKTVYALLGKTHNVDLRDESGQTPLSYAAENGREAVVKLLLLIPTVDPDSSDNRGQTPLSYAAENGREAVVKLLLTIPTVDLNSSDYRRQTPLSYAVENRHEAVVKLLLAMPSVNPNSSECQGQTPLLYAAEQGQEVIVKLLLSIPTINPDSSDSRNQTPLSYAAENGHEAVIKLLLAMPTVNLNSIDFRGQTPLLCAIKNRHEAVIKLLLAMPTINLNSTNYKGQTPVLYAAKNGHEAVIKLLLLMPTVDLDFLDDEGRTSLSYAAGNGHEATIKMLLDKGANVNLGDEQGRTPLSYAAEEGHEAVIKLLLNKGADANLRDEEGWAPLLWAVEAGHEVVIKLLLDKGADVDLKDIKGWTPLLWAVEAGHEVVIKLLLDKSADVNSKDDKGRTPLLWAAGDGHEAVIKLLLDKGADVNLMDDRGRTPLLWAAGDGHEAVIKLLLDKGADVNLMDDRGRTPLSWAKAKGHEAVIKLLQEKGANDDFGDQESTTPEILQ